MLLDLLRQLFDPIDTLFLLERLADEVANFILEAIEDCIQSCHLQSGIATGYAEGRQRLGKEVLLGVPVIGPDLDARSLERNSLRFEQQTFPDYRVPVFG